MKTPCLSFFLLFFIVGITAFGQVPRRPLVELFVNIECVPCSTVYPEEVNQLMAADSSVSAITYAMNWPGFDPVFGSYSAGMLHRKSFYPINSIPAARTNGTGGFFIPSNPGTSPISLVNRVYELRKPGLHADSLVMQTKIYASQALSEGHYLYMALTERELYVGPGASNIYRYRHALRHFFGAHPDSMRSALPPMAAGDSLIFEYRIKKSEARFRRLTELAGLSFVQRQFGISPRTVIQSSVIQPFEPPKNPIVSKIIAPNARAAGSIRVLANSYRPDTLHLRITAVQAPIEWSAQLKTESDSGQIVSIPLTGRTAEVLQLTVQATSSAETHVVGRYKISARYRSQATWTDSIVGFQFVSMQGVILLTSTSPTLSGYQAEDIKAMMAETGIEAYDFEYKDFVGLAESDIDTVHFPAIYLMVGGSYSSSIRDPFATRMKSYLDRGGRFFVSFVGAGSNGSVLSQNFIRNYMGGTTALTQTSSNVFTLSPGTGGDTWFTNFPSTTGPIFGSNWYLQRITIQSPYTTPAVLFNGLPNAPAFVKSLGPNGYRTVFGHVSFPELTPMAGKVGLLQEAHRFLFNIQTPTGRPPALSPGHPERLWLAPNPARGHSTLVCDPQWTGARYAVWDARGKEVQHGTISGESTETSLGGLPAGIYQIGVAGLRTTRRLVVE